MRCVCALLSRAEIQNFRDSPNSFLREPAQQRKRRNSRKPAERPRNKKTGKNRSFGYGRAAGRPATNLLRGAVEAGEEAIVAVRVIHAAVVGREAGGGMGAEPVPGGGKLDGD